MISIIRVKNIFNSVHRFVLRSMPLFIALLLGCSSQSIDRYSLVTRHNPSFDIIDSLGVLTVGNGNFAFTVDATGLQTFPEYYNQGIPLGTQSNWGWHSFPNVNGYKLEDVSRNFASCTDSVPYVYRYFDGERREASEYLRQNPHRLHLGLVGYDIVKSNGEKISVGDLSNIDFQLDMWTGRVSSQFEIEGQLVKTELFAHQKEDQISVKVTSPLISSGQLKISLRFPYGSGVDRSGGYDLDKVDSHFTGLNQTQEEALFKRVLDTSQFFVKASWEQKATVERVQEHHYFLVPDKTEESFDFSISFSEKKDTEVKSFEATRKNSKDAWEAFWESGGAIDFTGSSDPRAGELERRIILSQYLTKIQTSGNLPPQETGLTFNSWYGKFHLEMSWWHGVHFVLWNRPDLFHSSMDWYQSILPKALETAQGQGYQGVRWPKMVGPEGVEGPSNIGTFLIWQQPHPIYYAELFYRQNPSITVLEEYQDVVFATADFMTSFTCYNDSTGFYDLTSPLIPAQEVFDLNKTLNPSFELAYWYYALSVAQKWRERLNLEPDQQWQEVLDNLAPLPIAHGMYLPHQNRPDAYNVSKYMNDHPIALGSLGFLPQTEKVDSVVMQKTFEEIWNNWNWDHTWGWDYPLVAMTAARLGMPEKAVDALLMPVKANTYLKNGHNYQNKKLTIYLPGNGGLLSAIAMMASGWKDGPQRAFPGFPDNENWTIRVENINKIP